MESEEYMPPQYGYSQDALVSRRMILQAACETLANRSSRRDYNLGLAGDEIGIILTQVPWDKIDLFAATPSNIPAESSEVYRVALALVAQAFVDKKPHLIQDADNHFQQLQQTKVTVLANSMTIYTVRETLK
ncbi:hypothetical protein ACH5RR_027447 [Cinchona calisaya]|uniref:Plastid division protein CDP1-like 2nd alpha solenoid domain-containing protein n=1 Tax=Cinchona calisaya TaxID=153742 RepID=A0ABD2Z5J5_9GENT